MPCSPATISWCRGTSLPRIRIPKGASSRQPIGRVHGAAHAAGVPGGANLADTAGDQRDHRAAPESAGGGQGAGNPGRAVGRATGGGRGRRLDAGGVRGAEPASLRGAGRSHRRVHPGLQGAVDQRRSALRGQVRQLRQHQFPAEAGAEAASAHLGRR